MVPSYDLKVFLYFIPRWVSNTVGQFIKGELNLRTRIKPIIFYVNKVLKLLSGLGETEKVRTAGLLYDSNKRIYFLAFVHIKE